MNVHHVPCLIMLHEHVVAQAFVEFQMIEGVLRRQIRRGQII